MFNLHRALNQKGVDWIVPMCDSIFGLGKSEFADQYVKKCNERTALKPASSGLQLTFQQSMSDAHTVKITFSPGELRNEKTFEKVLVRKLQKTLIPMFKVAPICLFVSYSKSDTFLSELISDAGPVFVALDEIGSAFFVSGMDDLERRDLFLKFCEVVLSNWLLIPNLHFLLLGRPRSDIFFELCGSSFRNGNRIECEPI